MFKLLNHLLIIALVQKRFSNIRQYFVYYRLVYFSLLNIKNLLFSHDLSISTTHHIVLGVNQRCGHYSIFLLLYLLTSLIIKKY